MKNVGILATRSRILCDFVFQLKAYSDPYNIDYLLRFENFQNATIGHRLDY